MSADDLKTTWMSRLDDSTVVAEMKIPATHDSSADSSVRKASAIGRIGGFGARCQSMTLKQQLHAGTRYLDIRLVLDCGTLWTYHGVCKCGYSFANVLSIVAEFVREFPREAVLVQIQRQCNGGKKNQHVTEEMFAEAFIVEVGPYMDLVFSGESPDTTLGEIRGKIVFLMYHRLSVALPFGLLPIEKQWRSYTCKSTHKGVQEKMRAIEEGMRNSLTHVGLFGNECSAVGCVKGLEFIPYPKKMAKLINPLVEDMIDKKTAFRGVIMFDFPELTPSGRLIEKVILLNFPES